MSPMPSAPVFDTSYAALPERFYARLAPTPVRNPSLIALNEGLAREMGLDPEWLRGPDGLAMLAGVRVPEGATPMALAYAGHQFGGFVPQLGDGRALLLGEVRGPDDRRWDIQLKGSGQTPFSRRGDGRSALGPALREYLISEAMHALGIPTTRSLAVMATGEHVMREEILPGAILTRVASSHIRVGTFQYFAARGDREALTLLLDHAIQRHDPAALEAEIPALAFLEGVVRRQADLVARWLHVGFIHGVMNTDNMSVSGETIDYGPCAFMDRYDPATVFSSIDQTGRYAYGNQPSIARWNLARLAETLLPLLAADEETAFARAQSAIGGFADEFQKRYLAGLRAKIGLEHEHEGDEALIRRLLSAMAEGGADMTVTFRSLSLAVETDQADDRIAALFPDSSEIRDWLQAWRRRLKRENQSPEARANAMDRINPGIIPRNHKVEDALTLAVAESDFALFHRLVEHTRHPFSPDEAAMRELMPPVRRDPSYRTFCGT